MNEEEGRGIMLKERIKKGRGCGKEVGTVDRRRHQGQNKTDRGLGDWLMGGEANRKSEFVRTM